MDVNVSPIATVELCVGKTGLEGTLYVQVEDSGLVRPGPVVIHLIEWMDWRQRMPVSHSSMVSSHGCSK